MQYLAKIEAVCLQTTDNGNPPEITFKLFVRILSLIAWRVTNLYVYVTFVYLWWYFIYITTWGHYQCVSVRVLFGIAYKRKLTKVTIYINSKKQNNLTAHSVAPVFSDGITWTDIYIINTEKLKAFTKNKRMLVSVVILVMVNLAGRII